MQQKPPLRVNKNLRKPALAQDKPKQIAPKQFTSVGPGKPLAQHNFGINKNLGSNNNQSTASIQTNSTKSTSVAPTEKKRELKVGDEIVERQSRLAAIGDTSTCKDPLLKYILVKAETLFMPKKIIDSGDWLVTHQEYNQTYEIYQKPNIKNLVTHDRSTIYIFVIDPSINDDFLGKLKQYCQAFYTDMKIQILKPHDKNLLGTLKIPNRINSWSNNIQYNANEILKKMPKFVPKDAYCMLTVTMQDLYPYDSWNFVFGWANYKARTGVFSFGRYHPSFNGCQCESGDPDNELLENACYVMVHEIGHMYGMTHCTFYECIMNGFNGYEEQRRFKRYLCPVCLRKLQSNLQFDVRKRFKNMQDICAAFKFTEMAKYYENALEWVK